MENFKGSLSEMVRVGRSANMGGDFLVSSEGSTIFKRSGDDEGDGNFAGFLFRPCPDASGCVAGAERPSLFPNPGETKIWPCGCKCAAFEIPPNVTLENLKELVPMAYLRLDAEADLSSAAA